MLKVNCYNVTLATFIDCVADGNYTGLPNGLVDYLKLIAELAEITPSELNAELLSLDKDAAVLERQAVLIKLCVMGLAVHYDAGIALELATFGVKCPSDYGSDAYFKALKKASNLAKSISINAEGKRKEAAALSTSQSNTGKTTRADFTKINIALSEHNGYRIDANVVSLAEWAFLRADLDRYNDERRKLHALKTAKRD